MFAIGERVQTTTTITEEADDGSQTLLAEAGETGLVVDRSQGGDVDWAMVQFASNVAQCFADELTSAAA